MNLQQQVPPPPPPRRRRRRRNREAMAEASLNPARADAADERVTGLGCQRTDDRLLNQIESNQHFHRHFSSVRLG